MVNLEAVHAGKGSDRWRVHVQNVHCRRTAGNLWINVTIHCVILYLLTTSLTYVIITHHEYGHQMAAIVRRLRTHEGE